MADLLAKTPLTPEQSTYVEAIATSSTALLGLVNDMLDAGKLEAGRWQLRPRPMSPEALVEEVIELLAPKAQAKGLELAAHVAVHVPERVEADPDQLVRILMNLTGNAIKFTDVGGVAIDVSLRAEPICAVTLAFRVRDSGIGIAPEHHDRIFQDYEQADSGSSGRQVGTGLGLAIAREIAARWAVTLRSIARRMLAPSSA